MKVDLRWRGGGYDQLYFFRMYEPSLTALIRAAVDSEGAEFVDVGANIGAFCFLAADVLRRRGGRALAVEPLPQNLAYLDESRTAGSLQDVIEVAPFAAGDQAAALTLEVMAPGEIANARPTSWLGVERPGGRLVDVPMVTLDSLTRDWHHVRFVKIDVEGAELFVLRGAVELLARERPLVYCEFHREFTAANGTTAAAIESFVESIDYDIRYLGECGRISSSPPAPDSRFLDLVLVPRNARPDQLALVR